MATTVLSQATSVMGDQRVVLANLTTSAASDTYNTGLGGIRSVNCNGGSAAVTNVTVSGGTVTIVSSGGVTGLWLTAFGW